MERHRTILVTRPEPGAGKTISALSAIGLSCVKVPFTEMVAKSINAEFISALESSALQIDGIVVTSANALRYAAPNLLRVIATVPVFAVGDATAQFARELGFTKVYSADGNAQDLCALVRAKLLPHCNLIYLCGVTRSDDVERELHHCAYNLTTIETYETVKVSQLTHNLQGIFREQKVDSVLFYSSLSAQLFAAEYDALNAGHLSDVNAIFCISQKAKNALPSTLSGLCIVCPTPRDDEMISVVRRFYGA
ncbi:MAG: uroporphyrinogen-III synthase [Ahrensia sp.]|nr:uroporphyrinogen-III synthase [Ahrensia sp.]